MSRIQAQLEDLSSNLFEAREDIDTAKTDLEDTESNRLLTSFEALKNLLSDGETINLTGLHCYIKCCIVTEIERIGDDIRVSVVKPFDDVTKIYAAFDLSGEEIYYLASFLTLIAIERANEDEDDDYKDDVNDDKTQQDNDNTSTKVIQFPAISNKTEINEDIFWNVVNAVNWKDIYNLENPINLAKNTIIGMGFSVEQIKQLRDIFIRLQNELVLEIKTEYADQDFAKSDYKINEICDYIIGLGDDLYVDIFNGIEDITPYVEPHPIHFLQCFG